MWNYNTLPGGKTHTGMGGPSLAIYRGYQDTRQYRKDGRMKTQRQRKKQIDVGERDGQDRTLRPFKTQ